LVSLGQRWVLHDINTDRTDRQNVLASWMIRINCDLSRDVRQPMIPFLVGRQPIFDDKLNVYGYELLFRKPAGSAMDADAMTAEVLVHASLDLGFKSVVGSKLAFINATRSFIVGELPVGLPPEQTVIEILEDVALDTQVLAGCRRLVREGYRLALDDYVFREGDEPLLELANIVKLDVLAMPGADLAQQVEHCAGYGLQLLAEKVETRAQLAACHDLGFGLFQGYLLSRPSMVASQALTPNRLTCLRLTEKLCDPDISAEDVTSVIETDPGLSYRLLHAAGMGVAGGFRRQLHSVRDGIVQLGTRRLRDWVILMLLADTHEGSAEQLTIAMTRARMSELLADATVPTVRDSAFTIGLLSALDLLLEAPLPEIIKHLSLSSELVDGLLDHTGALGRILDEVLSWERGIEGPSERPERDLVHLAESYVQALAWATDICKVLDETS
jgi:EAL and modified HD-GYP domain-containing signal transduction protein